MSEASSASFPAEASIPLNTTSRPNFKIRDSRLKKAEETRKLQELSAKAEDDKEKKRLKEMQKKIKTKGKKDNLSKKKTTIKKNPLTTTKK